MDRFQPRTSASYCLFSTTEDGGIIFFFFFFLKRGAALASMQMEMIQIFMVSLLFKKCLIYLCHCKAIFNMFCFAFIGNKKIQKVSMISIRPHGRGSQCLDHDLPMWSPRIRPSSACPAPLSWCWLKPNKPLLSGHMPRILQNQSGVLSENI